MTTDYPIRPPSEQLVDLHVYLLPREVWNEKYSSTYNESIREASSAGFVRVWPDLTVCGLRTLIEDELGDSLPQNYVFLRSVGRCMTQIKPRQELELKCKAFLPPTAWAPEIVVLEASRDSMSVPMYQSFPGYSPRPNATQPINGIPTHFPQVANHDRMAPSSDGMIVPSQHNTHPPLVAGDSPTMHSTSIPGQRLPPSSNHHPYPPPQPYPTHNPNLTNSSADSAQRSNQNHPVAVPHDSNYDSRRMDNPNTSANNSASFKTVQPLPLIAHHTYDVLVVKSQSGSRPQHSTLKNTKKSHPVSSNPADPSDTQSNSDDDTNQVVADVASPTNKRTTNNASPAGKDVAQDTAPATTGLHHHHTNNLHHHHHLRNNIHQSGSRRLSHNDPNSVSFPAPLSATPPDTPTSDPPPPGQSPMVQQQQQQQGYKGDPLGSGRPDAYTNSTNEDSGIAEPTPDDDDDPDYERRKSDTDDPYYNQLHPDQTQNRQFQQTERSWDESDRYQEKEKEEERQRQAEIQQREEERREEEERIEVERQREEERREVERQREEERREHDRKLEQKRQEEVKKQRQREMEERKKEEEKMKEEMKEKEAERQRGIAERERAAAFDSSMPLSEGEEEYNDATIAMETNQAPDGRGHFLNDEQMRRRAEDELEDYEPQSTWRQDGGGETAGHPRHPGSRRNRSREDTEMEMASQQAVQDGLKRVHLTPEVHRKAKIGKIRNSSITDEEDIYETDPEMADLLQQLQVARQERVKKEKERENLIKRAKDLQTKTHERRNRSLNESRPRSNSVTPDLATRPRDYWKKRYYDEKKKTAPMEEQVSRVRNQLDQMHRKLLSHIEGGKKKGASVKGPPSKKNDHKINILKMQHELEEIKRKVDKSRMKLTSEIKLRNQAEEEVRGLKSEVTQRKINTTLIRNQKLAALKMGDHKLLSKTPIPALGKGPLSLSAKR
eukprot:XP_011667907.1 PREDICTED: zinc finger CCCH domain-containing protein 13 isoform X1 [Strongylocentrotus purpuratus]